MIDTIYFIQGQKTHLIKIGISYNIEQRLQTFKTMLTEPFMVLTTVRGTLSQEQEIHGLFKKDNSHGEWFYPSDALLDFIEFIKTISLLGLKSKQTIYSQYVEYKKGEQPNISLDLKDASESIDALLSLSDAARLLRMDEIKLRKMIKDNLGPPFFVLPNNAKHPYSFWRFRKRDVTEWLERFYGG